MTKFSERPGMMKVAEVAEYFGCNVSSIWRWTKAGNIPAPVKIAGTTRWRRAEIEAFGKDPGHSIEP